MIDDPEPPFRRGPERARLTASSPSQAPLDEWEPGGSDAGWAVLAAQDAPQPDVASHEAAADDGRPPPRPAEVRPVVLRLLRPWFEPRPGELRGAIVLLAVALAASLALWFDAARRPDAAFLPLPPGPAVHAQVAVPPAAELPGARADGSDGWGIDAPVVTGAVVHVSGAVRTPGVVRLPERARVADAIDAAGGAMPDARLDRLNLARVVADGERVHVPRVGEDAPPPEEPGSRAILPDGRLDLNLATQAELETLPGVGPARAQAIIAEREARPFRVPGDLRRVPGIGEATFQRLAPLVAVR